MKNKLLFVGALFGLLSVMMGAYIDHVLTAKLSEHALHSVSSAQRFLQYYALVICLIGFSTRAVHSRLLVMAGWMFITGTFCFSFGINAAVLLGFPALIKIVPVGGGLVMLAWILLAGCAFAG